MHGGNEAVSAVKNRLKEWEGYKDLGEKMVSSNIDRQA